MLSPVEDDPPAPQAREPEDTVAQHEAVVLVEAFVNTLDDARRQVFVLADIEGMTAPEIAQALHVNVNTVYSRLRSAREQFEGTLARHRARQRRHSWNR